jgi:sugar (pentulose or hexulose) kinase
MTLIGIDIGSSSVKVAAYSEDGRLVALTTAELTPIHSAPGLWETNPIDVWLATSRASASCAGTKTIYTPNPERAKRHKERLEKYNKLMRLLLAHIF